jgi:hypothetical protein
MLSPSADVTRGSNSICFKAALNATYSFGLMNNSLLAKNNADAANPNPRIITTEYPAVSAFVTGFSGIHLSVISSNSSSSSMVKAFVDLPLFFSLFLLLLPLLPLLLLLAYPLCEYLNDGEDDDDDKNVLASLMDPILIFPQCTTSPLRQEAATIAAASDEDTEEKEEDKEEERADNAPCLEIAFNIFVDLVLSIVCFVP